MKIVELYNQILTEATKGSPIVAYHGSTHKFSSFTDEFVGGKDATDQEGPGIYFTTSLKDASAYGEFLYKVTLTPRKLLDASPNIGKYRSIVTRLTKMAPNWKETAQNWAENPERGVINFVNSILQFNENEKDLFQQVWFDFYRYSPVEYVRNVVKLGYDGIIIDGYNTDKTVKHIIVYNPAIIKYNEEVN